MSTSIQSGQRGDYTAFFLAAIVYAIGVAAFSFWLYLSQRASMKEHFDKSVLNATYTTREILGTGRARTLIREGDTSLPVYNQHRERMERFAGQCGFSSLVIAVREADQVHAILSGNNNPENETTNPAQYGEPLPDAVAEAVRTLAAQGATGPVLFDLAVSGSGLLRVAVVYEPETAESGYAFIAAKDLASIEREFRLLAIHMVVAAVFMLSMAVPLVVLYSRTQRQTALVLAELNGRLQSEVARQKSREAELRDAIEDLGRLNTLTVGRENRVIELKNEVNMLLEQMNRTKRYNTEKID